MKKIYNIIDSELILRTNNHRLRQEFGVGTSESISADGTTTIFTTKAVIREKLRYSKWSCLNRRSSLRARNKEQLELVIAGLL
jgi:hypothetical protein